MAYVALTSLPSLGLKPGDRLPASVDAAAVERWLKAKKIEEASDAPSHKDEAPVEAFESKKRGRRSSK
jgi:hypothetical protein